MKNRSTIYLRMAAMILTAALAVSAAPHKQVPFKGALQGRDADSNPTDKTVVVTTTGTGIGTLLGQFSFIQVTTVDFTNGTDAGTATWIAANGDKIFTTIAGSGEQVGDLISITEINTITGGTGRFSGAQGSFTVERLASPTTFMTSGSFHGAVSSPGAH